jgi:hypothetical protein
MNDFPANYPLNCSINAIPARSKDSCCLLPTQSLGPGGQEDSIRISLLIFAACPGNSLFAPFLPQSPQIGFEPRRGWSVNSIWPVLVMRASEYTKPFCFSTRLRIVFSCILKPGWCEWSRSKPHLTDSNSRCFPCLIASDHCNRYHYDASVEDRALVGTNSSATGVRKQARGCFGSP